jgi:hypothetical protein
MVMKAEEYGKIILLYLNVGMTVRRMAARKA